MQAEPYGRKAQAARSAGAPSRPRDPDRRSDNLLDAASALFMEVGVYATRIDDIVERAGVAKGTFYHYFPDRSAMIEAMRRRYFCRLAERVEIAMASQVPDDLEGRLAAWLHAIASAYFETHPLHDAIFRENGERRRCVISGEAFVGILASLLSQGAAAGIWSVNDPLSLATFVFWGLHGFFDEAMAANIGRTDMLARARALLNGLLG